MPGGSGPVQLALLPRLPDNAFRAFVRFPPGWSRPEAGHYPDPEEFVVLEGELGLNGMTWRAGDYAWIPARCLRRELVARQRAVDRRFAQIDPRIGGERRRAAESIDGRDVSCALQATTEVAARTSPRFPANANA